MPSSTSWSADLAAGKRHYLVLYRRSLGRLWPWTFFLGLLLLALWYYGPAFTSLYRPGLSWMFLAGGGYAAGLGLFGLLSRRMGYVRAHDRFLLVATPFFRFKTSYKRLRGVRSVDFHRLFDLEGLGWSQERFVGPLIGSTAVVVKLSEFPVSTRLLQLFFSRYFISTGDTELVFVVPNWMEFSVELDSRLNRFRQEQQLRKQSRGFQRGILNR